MGEEEVGDNGMVNIYGGGIAVGGSVNEWEDIITRDSEDEVRRFRYDTSK